MNENYDFDMMHYFFFLVVGFRRPAGPACRGRKLGGGGEWEGAVTCGVEYLGYLTPAAASCLEAHYCSHGAQAAWSLLLLLSPRGQGGEGKIITFAPSRPATPCWQWCTFRRRTRHCRGSGVRVAVRG